jgi:hypothetical protein
VFFGLSIKVLIHLKKKIIAHRTMETSYNGE